jgi:predicted RNase H-like nuclease
MTVVGVDAYRKGWVAIALDDDGVFETAFVTPTMRDLLLRAGSADVVAVDIPLGYPDVGSRQADCLARRFVGARRSSVFETPPPAVWRAADHAAATTMCVELVGRGLS